MKILNISSAHPLKTAGIVAYDFHKNMLLAGYESKILTLPFDDYQDENILSYHSWKYGQKISGGKEKLLSLGKKQYAFDPNFYFNGTDITKTKYATKSIFKSLKGYQPDIIVIQFAQLFLSAKNIYELSLMTGAPIYWYLMDMGPLTGGCAYAWDCNGYKNSCGNCPAIYSKNPNDVSAKNLAFKKEYLDKTDLRIINASTSHYQQTKESTLFKNKTIHQLFLAIDSEKYKPLSIEDKKAKRISYGIDPTKLVFFFGAVKISQERKGLALLLEALKLLQTSLTSTEAEKIQLVIAGNLDEHLLSVFNDEIHFDYVNVGFLNHTQLPEIFAVADCFICPSIEDSGPMMVNQSIMTGTPVVSFPTGVSNDLVMEGETGFMTKQKTPTDLSKAIARMIKTSEQDRKEMSSQCRNIGLGKLTYQAQRKRFAEIIQDKKEPVDK